MSVKIEKMLYFNQPNCYRLSNELVEVIVTTDIGPRIIAYRFHGGDNILAELGPNTAMKNEFGVFHIWGGHRLWHAPEVVPRSYIPDDKPVSFEFVEADGMRLYADIEPVTHIRKEMLIKLDAAGSRVSIEHKLTNHGLFPVELAPWALSVMNGGGVTIIPNEPFIPHSEKVLPARPMVLWHFTDLSDSRWTLGKKYIRLRTDVNLDCPQKAGFGNKQGWAGYLRGSDLFVKRFPYVEGAAYADFGANFETYTEGNFMEVESLGPVVKVDPGESAVHVERWYLFGEVNAGSTEDDLDAAISPLIAKTE